MDADEPAAAASIQDRARQLCGCPSCDPDSALQILCERDFAVACIEAGRDLALAELQACLNEVTVSLAGAIARVRALK